MALIQCKECGHEVSSKAASCPKCGVAVNAKGLCARGFVGLFKTVGGLAGALVVLAISASMLNGKKVSPTEELQRRCEGLAAAYPNEPERKSVLDSCIAGGRAAFDARGIQYQSEAQSQTEHPREKVRQPAPQSIAVEANTSGQQQQPVACDGDGKALEHVTLMDSRYIASEKEVLDKQTNLSWRRCAEGERWNGHACSGEAEFFDHSGAEKHAAQQSSINGVGWRVPTKSELLSLVVKSRKCPAIDIAAFGKGAGGSFLHEKPADYICCQSMAGVDFSTGTATSIFGDGARLRLVRSN